MDYVAYPVNGDDVNNTAGIPYDLSMQVVRYVWGNNPADELENYMLHCVLSSNGRVSEMVAVSKQGSKMGSVETMLSQETVVRSRKWRSLSAVRVEYESVTPL